MANETSFNDAVSVPQAAGEGVLISSLPPLPQGFKFVPETHEYFLDNVRLPGVTEVLKSVGIIDDRWFSKEWAWRGSVVHKCCELDDLGDLDESSVAEEAKGYLEAWRKCKQECGFVPDVIERCYFSEKYLFAGTPDRVGPIHFDWKNTVLDLKTGSIQPWTDLQLAAYSELTKTFERVAVALKADGTYTVKVYPVGERQRDMNIFLAALAIYNWRRQSK